LVFRDIGKSDVEDSGHASIWSGGELMRVSERLLCSKVTRLFQGCSSVPGMSPPLPAVAYGRRRCVAFSRKIVGWEVHERESADLAAILTRQAVLAEGCILRPLVLHADNGSQKKVTMEKPGITASCIHLDGRLRLHR
jgi:hypothetical protein